MTDREWHPVLAAHEGPTGTWRMIDPQGRVYGRVQIRRLNGEIRYRAELGAELLGWANSLKLATYRLHMAHLRQASGREGPPNAPR
ncbi:hypothetical protein ACPW96_04905 [Micromonospora sp. DT81.3]|uniref:hypothetical protein n=1 Tax=Actinomycetes TaxID=1760 RepID=UPI003CED835B